MRTHGTAADGVRLAVDRSGPRGRPVVVLVHGFPDDSSVWSPVAARLPDYDVVTYDVRGAGASDHPRGRRPYALPKLADDLRRVIDDASPDAPVHLVAHDWGACAAWYALPRTLAGRIATYTSISGPDLDRVRPWMREAGWRPAVRQMRSSAYIGFFVTPGAGLAARWIAAIVRADPSRLRTPVSRADVRAGLGLYRANMFRRREEPRPVAVPLQIVTPTRDRYIGAAVATHIGTEAGEVRVTALDGGHWLPLSDPDALAGAVRAFIER